MLVVKYIPKEIEANIIANMSSYVKLPRKDLPKPLVLLKCPRWHISDQGAVSQKYKIWIQTMLWRCNHQGFYAIVEIPVQFVGFNLSDKTIKEFLGEHFPSVFATYLSQGTLERFDYYTRLYSLLRPGFTINLIIDDQDKADHGTYVEHARDAAYCDWQSGFVERKRFIKTLFSQRKRFFDVVSEETYLRRENLWHVYLKIWNYLKNKSPRRSHALATESSRDRLTS